MMKEHHKNDCVKFPISCPQYCGIAKFPRSDLEEHLKVCRNTIVSCNFNSLGCEAKVKRRHIDLHMRDGAFFHADLLKRRLKLMTDHLKATDKDFEKAFHLAFPVVVKSDAQVSDEQVTRKSKP